MAVTVKIAVTRFFLTVSKTWTQHANFFEVFKQDFETKTIVGQQPNQHHRQRHHRQQQEHVSRLDGWMVASSRMNQTVSTARPFNSDITRHHVWDRKIDCKRANR